MTVRKEVLESWWTVREGLKEIARIEKSLEPDIKVLNRHFGSREAWRSIKKKQKLAKK